MVGRPKGGSNVSSTIQAGGRRGSYREGGRRPQRKGLRRAERRTWAAIHGFGTGVNPLTAKYLNRCSDLLFVLARVANKKIGDQLWVPGANR